MLRRCAISSPLLRAITNRLVPMSSPNACADATSATLHSFGSRRVPLSLLPLQFRQDFLIPVP